jgi:hypothetical protein
VTATRTHYYGAHSGPKLKKGPGSKNLVRIAEQQRIYSAGAHSMHRLFSSIFGQAQVHLNCIESSFNDQDYFGSTKLIDQRITAVIA